MCSTSEKIMNLAQDYIQIRGYNAFSYKDLAQDLKIKTSSIHYHFPKKEDLGVAITRRYTEKCIEFYGGEVPLEGNHLQQFKTYLQPFIMASESGMKICLCGALSGEGLSLPQALQAEVFQFITYQERWLASLLDSGQKAGIFSFKGSAEAMALVTFSTLQGALTISRAKNDRTHFDIVVKAIERAILIQPPV